MYIYHENVIVISVQNYVIILAFELSQLVVNMA